MNKAVELPIQAAEVVSTQEFGNQRYLISYVLTRLRRYFQPRWLRPEIDDLELFYRAYMFYNRKVLEHHPYMWDRLHSDLDSFNERNVLPHFVMATFYRIFIAVE